MQIEVLKVDVENQGKYKKAVVAYKGADGKVAQKQLVSFGAGKDAYDKLVEATQGDLFEITAKDDKGYWQWVGIAGAGKAGVAMPITRQSGAQLTAPTISPRSTYETPEERAKKQVYIVRQSSITAALTLAELRKEKPTVNDVLAVAKDFERFVFDQPISHEQEDYIMEIK